MCEKAVVLIASCAYWSSAQAAEAQQAVRDSRPAASYAKVTSAFRTCYHFCNSRPSERGPRSDGLSRLLAPSDLQPNLPFDMLLFAIAVTLALTPTSALDPSSSASTYFVPTLKHTSSLPALSPQIHSTSHTFGTLASTLQPRRIQTVQQTIQRRKSPAGGLVAGQVGSQVAFGLQGVKGWGGEWEEAEVTAPDLSDMDTLVNLVCPSHSATWESEAWIDLADIDVAGWSRVEWTGQDGQRRLRSSWRTPVDGARPVQPRGYPSSSSRREPP